MKKLTPMEQKRRIIVTAQRRMMEGQGSRRHLCAARRAMNQLMRLEVEARR